MLKVSYGCSFSPSLSFSFVASTRRRLHVAVGPEHRLLILGQPRRARESLRSARNDTTTVVLISREMARSVFSIRAGGNSPIAIANLANLPFPVASSSDSSFLFLFFLLSFLLSFYPNRSLSFLSRVQFVHWPSSRSYLPPEKWTGLYASITLAILVVETSRLSCMRILRVQSGSNVSGSLWKLNTYDSTDRAPVYHAITRARYTKSWFMRIIAINYQVAIVSTIDFKRHFILTNDEFLQRVLSDSSIDSLRFVRYNSL